MNCCLHHKKVAIVFFCEGCGKALCWECCHPASGIQKQVCSECAGSVRRQPDSVGVRDSIFRRFCSTVFLAILLPVLAGGVCTLGAQWAINVKTDEVQVEKYGGALEYRFHSPFNLFFYTGITDWRAQFAMGSTVGAGALLLYHSRNNRKIRSKH